MSDSKNANNDPSMDDILASIRKIISDDEARAQVSSQQAASQAGRPAGAPPETAAKSQPDGHDDVHAAQLREIERRVIAVIDDRHVAPRIVCLGVIIMQSTNVFCSKTTRAWVLHFILRLLPAKHVPVQ